MGRGGRKHDPHDSGARLKGARWRAQATPLPRQSKARLIDAVELTKRKLPGDDGVSSDMSEPKLHHHLPQSYQAGFCGADSRLFVFDRATGKFRKDTPKSVAAITHDYTIFRDGEVRDTRVEKFLAEVDGTAVPIAKKLRDRVPLTADERQSYAWYIAFFAVRVPRFRRWLSETETAKRKLHDRKHLRSPAQLQHLIDNSGLTDSERAEANAELMFDMLKSEDYIVTVGHDYGVRLLMEAGCDLMPKIHDIFWVVAHATEGAEFITPTTRSYRLAPTRR